MIGLTTVGAGVGAATLTTIAALGLSHPVVVWLTYYDTLQTAAVEGVGAVALPVPPVATVYQSRLVPVAVNETATAF